MTIKIEASIRLPGNFCFVAMRKMFSHFILIYLQATGVKSGRQKLLW